MVERLRVELPDGIEPLGEVVGWRCSTCGGRFSLPEIRQAPTAVDLLLDAARTHRC